MICGSGGSKSRRVRSHLARGEMKNCTPLWREAHFELKMHKTPQLRSAFKVEMWKKCTPPWREAYLEVKMYKTHNVQSTFGSCDVQKVHAVVARSTFRSQNVQNTPHSEHLWEVAMFKKCTTLWREAHFEVKMYETHQHSERVWEVETFKKCTQLWCEAHVEVKMYKTPGVRATFGS